MVLLWSSMIAGFVSDSMEKAVSVIDTSRPSSFWQVLKINNRANSQKGVNSLNFDAMILKKIE